jgi:hypothetical protein
MPDEWFYVKDKKKQGPVTFAQLQSLAASGQIHRADMLLQGGTTKWVAAESVAGLFPAQAGDFPIGTEEAPPPDAPSPGELEVFAEAQEAAERIKPHQGDLLFLLGISSMVASGVGLLGILWYFMLPFSLIALGVGVPTVIKAGKDIRGMKANRIDPAGEGQAQQGRLFGMIGAIAGGVTLAIAAVVLLFRAELRYFT